MSQGYTCKCPESKKPLEQRRWVVWQRNANRSAFSGYRVTSSDYSAIQCHACRATWRSKCKYVDRLRGGQLI